MIDQYVEYLRQGKTVVYPTDTSYALGCDALNSEAVKKIFLIKGRTNQKPLSVICGGVGMVSRYFHITKEEHALIDKYWPGSLSILLLPKEELITVNDLNPSALNKKISVRVSSQDVATQLSNGLGGPIVATSANVSDMPDKFDVAGLQKQYEGRLYKPDFYLDTGPLPLSALSTVVEVINGEVKIIRQGKIKL